MRYRFKTKVSLIGEVKIKAKFAWFPWIVDSHLIWLEKYKATYVYTQYTMLIPETTGLEALDWLQVKRELI